MAKPIVRWLAQEAPQHLPVRVIDVQWAAESLTIWGDGWSFSTMSSWRLSAGGSFVGSCFHEPSRVREHLVGRSLDRVSVRAGPTVDDVTLEFGDAVLEVFSDMEVEPWVMNLGGGIYVPSNIGD